LHIEKAMDVIRFGEQPGGKVEPVRVERGVVRETYFIACRYFALEKWEFSESVAAETSRERFELMIILEGSGRFEWNDSLSEYGPAQAWMIPAALGAYRIEPTSRTALLRTYVPHGMNEFVERLRARGVPEQAASRLVYP